MSLRRSIGFAVALGTASGLVLNARAQQTAPDQPLISPLKTWLDKHFKTRLETTAALTRVLKAIPPRVESSTSPEGHPRKTVWVAFGELPNEWVGLAKDILQLGAKVDLARGHVLLGIQFDTVNTPDRHVEVSYGFQRVGNSDRLDTYRYLTLWGSDSPAEDLRGIARTVLGPDGDLPIAYKPIGHHESYLEWIRANPVKTGAGAAAFFLANAVSFYLGRRKKPETDDVDAAHRVLERTIRLPAVEEPIASRFGKAAAAGHSVEVFLRTTKEKLAGRLSVLENGGSPTFRLTNEAGSTRDFSPQEIEQDVVTLRNREEDLTDLFCRAADPQFRDKSVNHSGRRGGRMAVLVDFADPRLQSFLSEQIHSIRDELDRGKINETKAADRARQVVHDYVPYDTPRSESHDGPDHVLFRLGDFIQKGVCNERAMLLQVSLQYLGIDSRMEKGRFLILPGTRHAWVRAFPKKGKTLILDPREKESYVVEKDFIASLYRDDGTSFADKKMRTQILEVVPPLFQSREEARASLERALHDWVSQNRAGHGADAAPWPPASWNDAEFRLAASVLAHAFFTESGTSKISETDKNKMPNPDDFDRYVSARHTELPLAIFPLNQKILPPSQTWIADFGRLVQAIWDRSPLPSNSLLTVLNPNHEERYSTVLGREAKADIRTLPLNGMSPVQSTVSRRHLEFRAGPDGFFICHMGETTGTALYRLGNNATSWSETLLMRGVEQEIFDGDVFRCGECFFQFLKPLPAFIQLNLLLLDQVAKVRAFDSKAEHLLLTEALHPATVAGQIRYGAPEHQGPVTFQVLWDYRRAQAGRVLEISGLLPELASNSASFPDEMTAVTTVWDRLSGDERAFFYDRDGIRDRGADLPASFLEAAFTLRSMDATLVKFPIGPSDMNQYPQLVSALAEGLAKEIGIIRSRGEGAFFEERNRKTKLMTGTLIRSLAEASRRGEGEIDPLNEIIELKDYMVIQPGESPEVIELNKKVKRFREWALNDANNVNWNILLCKAIYVLRRQIIEKDSLPDKESRLASLAGEVKLWNAALPNDHMIDEITLALDLKENSPLFQNEYLPAKEALEKAKAKLHAFLTEHPPNERGKSLVKDALTLIQNKQQCQTVFDGICKRLKADEHLMPPVPAKETRAATPPIEAIEIQLSRGPCFVRDQKALGELIARMEQAGAGLEPTSSEAAIMKADLKILKAKVIS